MSTSPATPPQPTYTLRAVCAGRATRASMMSGPMDATSKAVSIATDMPSVSSSVVVSRPTPFRASCSTMPSSALLPSPMSLNPPPRMIGLWTVPATGTSSPMKSIMNSSFPRPACGICRPSYEDWRGSHAPLGWITVTAPEAVSPSSFCSFTPLRRGRSRIAQVPVGPDGASLHEAVLVYERDDIGAAAEVHVAVLLLLDVHPHTGDDRLAGVGCTTRVRRGCNGDVAVLVDVRVCHRTAEALAEGLLRHAVGDGVGADAREHFVLDVLDLAAVEHRVNLGHARLGHVGANAVHRRRDVAEGDRVPGAGRCARVERREEREVVLVLLP